jgi:hypothetical protein
MLKTELIGLYECQEDMLRLHIADAIRVLGDNTGDDIPALTNEAMRTLRHCGLINAIDELAAFHQLQQVVIKYMIELRSSTQALEPSAEKKIS